MVPLKFLKDLIEYKLLIPNFEQFLKIHYSSFLKSGDVVLDIGANIGEHTSEFSRLVGNTGKVIAFEPIPELFEELVSKFSDLKNIVYYNYAVGFRNCTSDFNLARHSSGSLGESGIKKRIYNFPDEMESESIEVQLVTLDSLNIPRKIKYIKIDTEGGEIDIIKSAFKLITRDRPFISVEYGEPTYSVYGYDKDTLWKLCKELDYSIYDILLNRVETLDEWLTICDSIYWDYLLIPDEKCDNFELSQS